MSAGAHRQIFRAHSFFFNDANVSVGFSDHSPMVIATTAALNQLNQHLDEPTMISRFRANIIIDGCETNSEYSWDEIQIGDVNFEIVNDCARCSITAVTQETALPSLELLKTLATVGRRSDKKPVFGVHARPTTVGVFSLSSPESLNKRARSYSINSITPIYPDITKKWYYRKQEPL